MHIFIILREIILIIFIETCCVYFESMNFVSELYEVVVHGRIIRVPKKVSIINRSSYYHYHRIDDDGVHYDYFLLK